MKEILKRVYLAACLLLVVAMATAPALFAQKVSLLFIGDIMGHSSQINSAKRDSGRYDYRECFQYMAPYFHSADLCIGNLEVTLAGEPYTGYPTFSSPDALFYALHDAGVNMFVTANNHSCDRGKKGVERTIQVIDQFCIPRTGTFLDSLDKVSNHPLLLSLHGIRLAFLNYTYGTNGLPVFPPNMVNHIDTIAMKADIKKAKMQGIDKLIVLIHWGEEYAQKPSKYQTNLTAFLQREGVDIIIGSHPHVVQPMHFIKDGKGERVVVYSLGNFISNQREPRTDGGVAVRIELTKNEEKTTISHMDYMLTWVHIPDVKGKKKFFVLPASMYDRNGVPEDIPGDYTGMKKYLNLAREVMKKNTNVAEVEPKIAPI